MAVTFVHYLPLSVFVLLPGTFIVTYIMAITLKHIPAEFPYISDTGTHTPESCIFSLMLNTVSFLIVLTMYVRYKQIEQYYRDHLSPLSKKILSVNSMSLWVGCIASIGLAVVANFQETSVFRVHMVGALVSFGFGCFYSWMQTYMSFQMVNLVNSMRVAYFRSFLSFLMSVTFLSTAVCGPMALKEHDPNKDPTKWRPNDGGWNLHMVSVVSEWICALALDFFILTYVREMHRISLSSPRVMFIIENFSSNSPDPNDRWSDTTPVMRPAAREAILRSFPGHMGGNHSHNSDPHTSPHTSVIIQ